MKIVLALVFIAVAAWIYLARRRKRNHEEERKHQISSIEESIAEKQAQIKSAVNQANLVTAKYLKAEVSDLSKQLELLQTDSNDQKKRMFYGKLNTAIQAIILFGAVGGFLFLTLWGFYQSARQEAYAEGYDSGYAEGQTIGQDEGYENGYDVGYDRGYDVGLDIGSTNGYDEGYTAGYNAAIDYANEWINNHYGDGKDEYYSQTVYVTDTGDCYHEEWCSYLESKHPVTLQQAINQGYRPCSYCNPPD